MPRHAVKTTRKPFKRAGLHKLECPSPDCSGYAYSTVSQLETVGRPLCACGATFEPATFELAALLGLEDHPTIIDYRRRADRKARAQGPALKRPCQSASDLASMDERAALELIAEERADARARRVAALNRGLALADAPTTQRVALTRETDEIPF